MKNLKTLISSILFGSTLLFSTSKGTVVQTDLLNDNQKNRKDSISERNKKILHQKRILVLKQNNETGESLLVGHRSHRSHSSHRSHYSSRSGGTTTPKKQEVKKYVELGSRVLSKDMSGEDVNKLEKLLKKKGFNIHPDNHFGSKTEKIIKGIQSNSGLQVTGKVNTLTLLSIKKLGTDSNTSTSKPSDTRSLIIGMKGNDVFELENLLKRNGYELKPDSLFDEYTEMIVKDFQSKNGIPIDGIAGPLTVYNLKKAKK